VEGHSVIASDVLARYAADAATDTVGVRSLVESTLHRHKGVRILSDEGRVSVELHVALEWGCSIPDVGGAVQRHVLDYLERMANVRPAAVNVVVEEIA
jgi:uncharacterized alkaline shock family protein YloU